MSFLHPSSSMTLPEITSKPSWKPIEGNWAGPPMELGVAWVDLIHLLWETSLLLIMYQEAWCTLDTVGSLCFPRQIYCSLPHFSFQSCLVLKQQENEINFIIVIHIIRCYLQKQPGIHKSKPQSVRGVMAAPAEGPHLGACKDPAGPQGLHCGRAAVTLLCSTSDHQHLPRAFKANHTRLLMKASMVHSIQPVYPLLVALSSSLSENPTGKGEMCFFLDSFSQCSHHHGNKAICQRY